MKYGFIRFKEFAEFRNGLNFDKSTYTTHGIKYIGVSNFGTKLIPYYN